MEVKSASRVSSNDSGEVCEIGGVRTSFSRLGVEDAAEHLSFHLFLLRGLVLLSLSTVRPSSTTLGSSEAYIPIKRTKGRLE